MRCARACRPASKPPGLARPRGARRRSCMDQCEPGSRSRRGPGATAPKSSYQDSCSRRPRSAGGASSPTLSRNRVRRASCSGSPITRPATRTSVPSIGAGSCADSTQPACRPAQPKPSSKAPSARPRHGRAHAAMPASTHSQRSHAGARAGRNRQVVTPASSAAAQARPAGRAGDRPAPSSPRAAARPTSVSRCIPSLATGLGSGGRRRCAIGARSTPV